MQSSGVKPARLLQSIHRLVETIGQASDLQEIYAEAMRALADTLGADKAAVCLFDEGGVMRFVAWRGLSAPYRQAADGHSPWTPDTRDAMPVLVADVRAELPHASLQEAMITEGIGALGFIPLTTNHRLLGKFMVYYAEPHLFTPDEVQIAQTVAAHVALVLDRRQSEQALELGNARLQAILENSATAISIKDLDGRYLVVNHVIEEILGRPRESIIGQMATELFPTEYAQTLIANDQRALAADQAPQFDERAILGGRVYEYLTLRFRFAMPMACPTRSAASLPTSLRAVVESAA